MSLFDSIGEFFGGGGGLLAPIASVGGAILGSNANKAAAEQARRAAEAEAAAIREGNALAQARYEQQRVDAQPAMDYLRRLVAQDPSVLSPGQQREFDGFMRDANARLAASGLRGAGRAGTAAVNEGAASYLSRLYDQNRHRSDTAARQLAGNFTQANTALAGIDRDTGRAGGAAAKESGYVDANATTANAAQWGSALGAIANLASRENKERQSQYPVAPRQRWTGMADFAGGDPAALQLV